VHSHENNEHAIEDLGKLDTTPIPSIPRIKIEYMNITGKQGGLIHRADAENTPLQTGKISVKFTEPVWVYDLTLWIAEDDRPKSEKLSRHVTATIKYARGGERELQMSAYDKYVDCYPKDFLTEVEFKFHGINKILILTPPACQKIVMTGLSADDFYDFCDRAGGYVTASKNLSETRDKIVHELHETNQKIKDSQDALEAISEQTAQANNALFEEEEKLNTAKLELSKIETQVSLLNSKSTDFEQRINESAQTNKNLIKNIQDNRDELQKLLANKNVFMEEFSAYVEQGKGNIQSYVFIGAILLGIVGLCLWRLISSAVALSNDPSILETVSAADLFISRLPLAFVLGLVTLVSMKILTTLLGKIFEIHQERLLLSKLSILAKDNSFFSANGVNIPGNIIYEKRVSLKMELLKEFLSGNYRGAAEKEKEIRTRFEEFREQFKKQKTENATENTEENTTE
jgi:hypothetical protein